MTSLQGRRTVKKNGADEVKPSWGSGGGGGGGGAVSCKFEKHAFLAAVSTIFGLLSLSKR